MTKETVANILWDRPIRLPQHHMEGSDPDLLVHVRDILAARVTDIEGDHATFHAGRLHSFDGLPAFAHGEERQWYRHGLRHRVNGPAWISGIGDE